MSVQLYVGNISYKMQADDLKVAFQPYGEVGEVKIIIDRATGRSKGFGFVEMMSADSAEKAIEALDGSLLDGRNVRVSQANPKTK